VRAIDGGHALRRDAKEAFRPPASFRRRVARAGAYVAFCFQTIESGIDGPNRNLSISASFDFPPNRNAVGLVIQSQNGKKHDVLEFSKIISL
jgi:hypothetical protein